MDKFGQFFQIVILSHLIRNRIPNPGEHSKLESTDSEAVAVTDCEDCLLVFCDVVVLAFCGHVVAAVGLHHLTCDLSSPDLM